MTYDCQCHCQFHRHCHGHCHHQHCLAFVSAEGEGNIMFAVTYPKSRRQTKQAIEPTAEFLCNAIYIKHSTQTTTSSHCKPISSNRQMKGASNIYDRKKIVNPGALSTCVLNQW